MAKLQNILIVTLAFAFIFIFIITMIYIKQIETSIDYKMNIENNFIFFILKFHKTILLNC